MNRIQNLKQSGKLFCVFIILIICTRTAVCQRFYVSSAKDKTSYSGFTDAFYAYSFNKPAVKDIPFVYNHNRHDEFNVNLMLLGISHAFSKARTNFGFQAGTYPKANYAAEPAVFQYIFQANA
ncbi:MAG: outer membrane beta-barrel protein, partial [Bacteroidetes bacterium]|nr:outer membrane beta-barrel protein [Bacteroidota bacterium]